MKYIMYSLQDEFENCTYEIYMTKCRKSEQE